MNNESFTKKQNYVNFLTRSFLAIEHQRAPDITTITTLPARMEVRHIERVSIYGMFHLVIGEVPKVTVMTADFYNSH